MPKQIHTPVLPEKLYVTEPGDDEPVPVIALSTRQAAMALGVSPRTLRNWRNEGKNPDAPRCFHATRNPSSPVLYLYSDLLAWTKHRIEESGR